MDIEHLFFEDIVPEAATGRICVPLYDIYTKSMENEFYNIKFSINPTSNYPYLAIQDQKAFINKLSEYIQSCSLWEPTLQGYNDYNKVKLILSLLWSNASLMDFQNPISYMEKRIQMNQEKILDHQGEYVVKEQSHSLLESDVIVSFPIQNIGNETPYLCNVKIQKENEIYYLPSIGYGISDNTCYIYNIQNKFSNLNNSYQKKIKRQLYKLNDGIMDKETDEYRKYREEGGYYPENISDVSVSAIISITVLISELRKKNINQVTIIPYLPVRYAAKETSSLRKVLQHSKKMNLTSPEKQRMMKKLTTERYKIQNNLTEKLLRDFFRFQAHFPQTSIIALPMETDENMHLVCDLEDGISPLLNEIIDQNIKIK